MLYTRSFCPIGRPTGSLLEWKVMGFQPGTIEDPENSSVMGIRKARQLHSVFLSSLLSTESVLCESLLSVFVLDGSAQIKSLSHGRRSV